MNLGALLPALHVKVLGRRLRLDTFRERSSSRPRDIARGLAGEDAQKHIRTARLTSDVDRLGHQVTVSEPDPTFRDMTLWSDARSKAHLSQVGVATDQGVAAAALSSARCPPRMPVML